jgi:uncharacterized protein YciI
MEAQVDWDGHAAFMDALADSGAVVLGGPFDGTPDALLIMRADSAEEIRARLAPDPWQRNGMLKVAWIHPWTIRLGALPDSG